MPDYDEVLRLVAHVLRDTRKTLRRVFHIEGLELADSPESTLHEAAILTRILFDGNCDCYRRRMLRDLASGERSAGDAHLATKLDANERKRMERCLREHQLSAWDPAVSLENFVAQAIKGPVATTGQTLAPAAFEGSMYFHYLHGAAGLHFGNVWTWQCKQGHCNASKVCSQCQGLVQFDDRIHKGLKLRAQLFVPVEWGGTHQAHEYWHCSNKACENYFSTDRGKTCPLTACGTDLRGKSRPTRLWHYTGPPILIDPQEGRELDHAAADAGGGQPTLEKEDIKVQDFLLHLVDSEWAKEWAKQAHGGASKPMEEPHWKHLLRCFADKPATANLVKEPSFQPFLHAVAQKCPSPDEHPIDLSEAECATLWTIARSVAAVSLWYWAAKNGEDIAATLPLEREQVRRLCRELDAWLKQPEASA